MKDRAALSASRKFHNKLIKSIQGKLKQPGSAKQKRMLLVGKNLSKKSLELHLATINLLGYCKPMAGAAGALLRPMFEFHLRGKWWLMAALGKIKQPDEKQNMLDIDAFISPPLGKGLRSDSANIPKSMLTRNEYKNAWDMQSLIIKLNKNCPNSPLLQSYNEFLNLKLKGYESAPTDYKIKDLLNDFVHGAHLQSQTGINGYTETLQSSFLYISDRTAWMSADALSEAHSDTDRRHSVSQIGHHHLIVKHDRKLAQTDK